MTPGDVQIAPLGERAAANPPAELDDAIRFASSVRRPWGFYLAVGWVIFVLGIATCASWLPLADPNAKVATNIPPFSDWPEFLGTDRFGRSVVSRLAFGARVSLAVGVVSAFVGGSVGLVLGMLAGVSRVADEIVGTLTDTVLAIPGIVLLIALRVSLGLEFGTPLLGPGLATLLLGLIIVSIPPFIRVSAGATRQVSRREYVEAARLLGARRSRIMVREILPAVLRPIVAYAIVVLAALIVIEASASFLNLGVQLPTASWGGMIRDGQRDLESRPELVLVPAFVLFVTVVAAATIGRWLLARTSPGEAKV